MVNNFLASRFEIFSLSSQTAYDFSEGFKIFRKLLANVKSQSRSVVSNSLQPHGL